MTDAATVETQSIVTHQGPAEVPAGCIFQIHGLSSFDEVEDVHYQGTDWSLAFRTFHAITCDVTELEGHDRIEIGYLDAEECFHMLAGEDRQEPEEEDELDEIDW